MTEFMGQDPKGGTWAVFDCDLIHEGWVVGDLGHLPTNDLGEGVGHGWVLYESIPATTSCRFGRVRLRLDAWVVGLRPVCSDAPLRGQDYR